MRSVIVIATMYFSWFFVGNSYASECFETESYFVKNNSKDNDELSIAAESDTRSDSFENSLQESLSQFEMILVIDDDLSLKRKLFKGIEPEPKRMRIDYYKADVHKRKHHDDMDDSDTSKRSRTTEPESELEKSDSADPLDSSKKNPYLLHIPKKQSPNYESRMSSRSKALSSYLLNHPEEDFSLENMTPYQQRIASVCFGIELDNLDKRRILQNRRGPTEKYPVLNIIEEWRQEHSPKKHQEFRQILLENSITLEAPMLIDDFYINPLDWSLEGNIAVALRSDVYIYEIYTKKTSVLTSLEDNEFVSSVLWIRNGKYLAVGTSQGNVYIYNTSNNRLVRKARPHYGRIGVMALYPGDKNKIITGSRDTEVKVYDFYHKTIENLSDSLTSEGEITSIAVASNERQIAVGSNANEIRILEKITGRWELRPEVLEHKAAIKALSWSPDSKFLASGGGTADKTLKIWQTRQFKEIVSQNMEAQITNLHWIGDLIITTHGYTENKIVISELRTVSNSSSRVKFEIKTISKHAHNDRVLFSAKSPTENKFITAAADETLKFWEFSVAGDKSTSAHRVKNSMHISRDTIFDNPHTRLR